MMLPNMGLWSTGTPTCRDSLFLQNLPGSKIGVETIGKYSEEHMALLRVDFGKEFLEERLGFRKVFGQVSGVIFGSEPKIKEFALSAMNRLHCVKRIA